MNAKQLPHVVIIGAGFGGLTAAKKLRNAPVRITLIDRQNYHLFQPLLYQVAIAGLIPSQVAYPVRTIFRFFFFWIDTLAGCISCADDLSRAEKSHLSDGRSDSH